ncbi:SRS domain-containing protein [Neospora caninum Liverpool]|uniref:SRS domain-containing protein n=1 Tax=Neospora caninum (strain Liverpool) TaxID=572307 RepID=F0VPJ9_NEOCL|nr:SRS domain-containing protein [Neospora caninum Liverpool]CBZ55645.1 SRS domain-containing protein [Neospora caninum Liverpool]CEL70387.1 TPA: SRS domain-containing protein [Neospora caninum Liverpool]|eukprot:XP_003885673.1 SRS domain-containing protein [Neospora caninum Liverpool]
MSLSFHKTSPRQRKQCTRQIYGVAFPSFVAVLFFVVAESVQIFVEAKGERLGTLKPLGKNRYSCVQEDGTGPNPGVGSIELNAQNPKLFLLCVGQENEFMPLDGATSQLAVCPMSATTKAECDRNSTPLKNFLPRATERWMERTLVLDSSDSKFVLTIPPNGFPPARQQFKLGCRAKGHYCMLTVTVDPFSAAVDGQRANCAYSLPDPVSLQLSMSEEKNSITILCGKQHFPQPSTYNLNYCAGSSVDPDQCAASSMTEIFPTFSASWWKGKSNSEQGAVFTIPKGHFPSRATHFLVGCSEKVDAGSFCNVKVSVAAATVTTTRAPSNGAESWRTDFAFVLSAFALHLSTA